MGKQFKTNGLVTLNTVSLFVIFLEGYVLGQIYEGLHIQQAPLAVIRLCSVSVIVVNVLGVLWFQRWSPSVGFKLWEVLKGVTLCALAVVFFHLLVVLYGAPVTENISETFHFACLLTSVAVLPPLLVLGTSGNMWTKVFASNSPETVQEMSVQLTTVFSLLGAWLGAFPIPLDWDRPWQVWPISCTIGTLGGYSIGLMWASQAILKHGDNLQKMKLG